MDTIAEPEKSAYELERGKPLPTRNHSILEPRIGLALSRFSDRFDVLVEPTLKAGDRKLTPDLALLPRRKRDWLHDEDPIGTTPLLTVEIVSAMQSLNSTMENLDTYFAQGVKSCWVVLIPFKSLTVFHSVDDSRTHDRGVVRDEALDVEVNLDALFA